MTQPRTALPGMILLTVGFVLMGITIGVMYWLAFRSPRPVTWDLPVAMVLFAGASLCGLERARDKESKWALPTGIGVIVGTGLLLWLV